MSPDLDSKLCEKYPKIFKNRHASMQVTAMCWGFECGDGWYNILDRLCSGIQAHIDWRRKQRLGALRYNRALKRANGGDISALEKYFSIKGNVTEYDKKSAAHALKDNKPRVVPENIRQVVAAQVKEKFGSLRFYYDGGDDYISGLVAMAESISEVTCEECGKPGKPNRGGWITVRCREHMHPDDLDDLDNNINVE